MTLQQLDLPLGEADHRLLPVRTLAHLGGTHALEFAQVVHGVHHGDLHAGEDGLHRAANLDLVAGRIDLEQVLVVLLGQLRAALGDEHGVNHIIGIEGFVHRVHSLCQTLAKFLQASLGDDNLLAYGVLMESDCLECDESADYCVFVYNMQPGITIDYRTGESWLSGTVVDVPEISTGEPTFILNTGTKKFHLLTCSRAPEKDSANYELTTKTRDSVIADGYSPCGICKP